ncbi:MAG: hypothetical protein ACXIUZ_02020 [Lysobacteraceae bacterium]
MARATRPRNTRSDVPSARPLDSFPPRVDVHASSSVETRDASADRLAGLASSLGALVNTVGPDVSERWHENQAKAGALDAARGGDPAGLDGRSRSYRDAFERVQYQADIRRSVREWDTQLQELPLHEMDEAEVGAVLDQWFTEKYAGIEQESRTGAAIVAEGLADFRAGVVEAHRERLLQEQQDRFLTNVRDVVVLGFEESLEDDGTGGVFDYAGLAELTASPGVPADQRASIYHDTVFQTAIEHGRPDLIQEMPDRFPNGSPTWKTTGNLDDRRKYLDAIARATRVAEAQEAQAADDLAALADEQRSQAQQGILEAIIRGDKAAVARAAQMGAAITAADGKPLLPVSEGLRYLGAARSERNDQDRWGVGAASYGFASIYDIATNDPIAARNMLIELGMSNQMQTPEGRRLFQTMQGVIDRHVNGARPTDHSAAMAEMRLLFPVSKDPMGNPKPDEQARYLQALQNYHDLTEREGISGTQAVRRIAGDLGTAPSAPTPRFNSGQDLIRAANDGSFPTDPVAIRSATSRLGDEELEGLIRGGRLPPAVSQAILDAYD